MVGPDKETNVCRGGGDSEDAVVVLNAVDVKVNGLAVDKETVSSGWGSSGWLTYKRRRNVKGVEGGKLWDDSVSQLRGEHLYDQAVCSHKGLHSLKIFRNGHSSKLQRNMILEQICESLDGDHGLKQCIKNALVFNPGSSSRRAVKESIHSCEDMSKCTVQTGNLCNGLHNTPKDSVGVTSSGSVSESNPCRMTEPSQCIFSDILMSEQFAQLCSLLLENFEGVKANKLFDLSRINSRIKEGLYESSPSLLESDIQEALMKLQKLGTDIAALAKSLSDKSMASFHEQVGNSPRTISEDDKHEFLTQESDMHPKQELTDACGLDKVHTCGHCGEKANRRDGLVCDSCEEMYHISCIEPAVKEIPVKSWFCTNCTAKGIESPHENCTACDRLNASGSPFNSNGEDKLIGEETVEELEDSSNELVPSEGVQRRSHCNVCRTEVINDDDDYRMCGHPFCPHKYYHARCLTSKQLTFYGPRWYCPSCLCRGCLTDQDDDKIVLCDGCDHAYHIYCMQPPRSTIPKGQWFCQKCDIGIQNIRKARLAYEDTQIKSRKRAADGNLKGEETLNKSGGVDMLLNAAKTLASGGLEIK